MKPIRVILYTKENCPLCDDALHLLERLREERPLSIELKDIYKNDKLLEKYQLRIPVIEINERVIAEGMVHERELLAALSLYE